MKRKINLFILLCVIILAACSSTSLATTEEDIVETTVVDSTTSTGSADEIGLDTTNTSLAALPILTESNQDLVFGPGQVVLALVEDLPPNSTLSVSMAHETQGILSTAATESDSSGRAVMMHVVRNTPDEEGARPEGQLWFSVHVGSINKEYPFNIAYDKPVPQAQTECTFYPDSPTLGSTVVFWCGGFEPGSYPQYRILVDGEEYLVEMEMAVPVGSDELLIDFFRILPDDPPGIWTVVVGEQEVSFQVTSP